jgi:hypothetical protein
MQGTRRIGQQTAIALIVAATVCGSVQRAAAVDWVDALRQCWNDNERNTRITCLFTEGQWRGTRSGRECLIEAVRTARSNDRENALRWILACRCGDGGYETRKAIRDREDDAVRFVVDSYGAFVQ